MRVCRRCHDEPPTGLLPRMKRIEGRQLGAPSEGTVVEGLFDDVIFDLAIFDTGAGVEESDF